MRFIDPSSPAVIRVSYYIYWARRNFLKQHKITAEEHRNCKDRDLTSTDHVLFTINFIFHIADAKKSWGELQENFTRYYKLRNTITQRGQNKRSQINK